MRVGLLASTSGLDERPGTQNALLAGFPIGVFSLKGEDRVEGEVDAGFVPEPDAEVLMVGSGRELYGLYNLPFDLSKVEQPGFR